MADAIRLLHLTDTHLLGDKQAKLRGVQPYATLQAVLADAERQFANVDATLLTGDLVHDDPQGYDRVRDAFVHSRVPVYCVPGNHDIPEVMYATLNGAPFNISQISNINNWIILLLNTWIANTADGELGDDQLAEIDSLLAEHADKHALLCLHHHPIAMGSAWLDTVALRDADDFRACVAKHSNVRGVLWGHVHQAMDTVIDGVRYMSTPSTCSQFLPHSDSFAVDNKPPGYRTLELLPNGNIVTEVKWLS